MATAELDSLCLQVGRCCFFTEPSAHLEKALSKRYPVIGVLSSLKIHKVTKSPFGLASRLSSHPELINFIQNGAVHITFGP